MNLYLTAEQIAERFGVPLPTVYGWRVKGYGPPALKIGRHLRFPVAEVERWEREQLEAQS